MKLKDAIFQVMVGTCIVVFSSMIIAAGAIVWNAATSYKGDIRDAKDEILAVIEVFSNDMNMISMELEYLRQDIQSLKNDKHLYVPDPIEIEEEAYYMEESMAGPPPEPIAAPEPEIVEEYQELPSNEYFQKQSVLERVQQSKRQIQQQVQQTGGGF